MNESNGFANKSNSVVWKLKLIDLPAWARIKVRFERKDNTLIRIDPNLAHVLLMPFAVVVERIKTTIGETNARVDGRGSLRITAGIANATLGRSLSRLTLFDYGVLSITAGTEDRTPAGIHS